jgi:hypothetical protein
MSKDVASLHLIFMASDNDWNPMTSNNDIFDIVPVMVTLLTLYIEAMIMTMEIIFIALQQLILHIQDVSNYMRTSTITTQM